MLNKKKIHAESISNSKGLILKIGQRSSPNHYRVYPKQKEIRRVVYDELAYGLEFELEIKKRFLQSFQHLLFSKSSEDLKEFEDQLTKHFYRKSSDWLNFNTFYTNWLLIRIRKLSLAQKGDHFLVTDYLKNSNLNSFAEQEDLFRFFQFLSFLRDFKDKAEEEYLRNQLYYSIEFPISDFFSYTNFTGLGGKRQKQLTKTLEFFRSL